MTIVIRIGERQYALIPVHREGDTMIWVERVVKRGLEAGANGSEEDEQYIFDLQSDIPADVFQYDFIFPNFRRSFDGEGDGVASMSHHNGRWNRRWRETTAGCDHKVRCVKRIS